MDESGWILLLKIVSFAGEHFLSVSAWLILASWFTAIIGAVFYYVWQHEAPNKCLKEFFLYSFPKNIINHKSTRMDFLYSAVNHFVERFTVIPLLIATESMSLLTYKGFSWSFGALTPGLGKCWLKAAMIVIVLLVQDFAVFFTHYLEHKIPILWEIHNVHHSPPVMTPLTNRRHHPWQLLWEGGCTNALAGFVLGSISYLANVSVLDNIMLGTDAYFIASILSFYHLRHSHIPLHYGPLEKWFLSPAQHQLHHSFETRDLDRNFSLWLSCWDRWAGTISYTDPVYQYRIGLPPKYDHDYNRVWRFFLIPPYNIANITWEWFRSLRPAQVAARVLLQKTAGAPWDKRSPGS
jgi:sterol desaturase/sphingolipid hydroxylase (fatty acid hydroxylase superfamily)